ncbi:MAG: hypothetical protein H7Z76_13770 [Methylotenera sp.]|nr:hypothetical protein [Flavobacterium sp.]
MKNILNIVAAITFAIQVNAQTGDPHFSMAKGRVFSQREQSVMQNGVMMRNGIVTEVKNGSERRMYEELKTLDGSKVLPDGTILRLDGTQSRLQEGERIFLSGTVNLVPKNEYVTMSNGRMTIVKDTIWIQMDRDLMLENGNRVFVQGYVITSDGKKVQFNEGDKISLQGNWMNDQPVFNSKLLQSSK